VLANFNIKKSCQALAFRVGYKNATKESAITTRITFVAQLVNSVVVPVVITSVYRAQFVSGRISYLPNFSMYWFSQTGNILIKFMVLNAYVPVVIGLVMGGVRALKRLLDRSCTSDKYKTKAKSLQAFMKIQKGPQFLVHLKYCSVLNCVFLTMMFGFGLPILFPICAMSLLLKYLLEMGMLYYSYDVSKNYER